MNEENKSANSNYEIIRVKSKQVSCYGASTESSHPLIYLNMGHNNFVICPYCSKQFTIKQSVDDKSSINPCAN